MRIFLAEMYCLFFSKFIIKRYQRNLSISAKIYCSFLFIYYCKKYHTNENFSSANFFLVPFCLLLYKVSYDSKYFWRKFIACSFLFIIVRSSIRIKIILAQICCFFVFVYYCKKYHTNGNISGANLLFAPFCLSL